MLGRLVVKNFGPIKDLDLEINEKMFLIGPQASGKSTVAKLVYFFMGFEPIVYQINRFYDVFGDIVYASDYTISFVFPNGDYLLFKADFDNDSQLFYPHLDWEHFTKYQKSNTIYIPANRSLMTYLLNNSYNVNNIDKSIVPFIDMVHWHRNNFNEPLKKLIAKKKATLAEGETINEEALYKIEELSKRIIKGELKYDNRPMIYFDGEKKVDLTYSSSGQQESVWIIQMIMVAIFNNQPTTLIVEEPEAHLFPEAQRVMIEIMSIFSNIPGNHIIVTTHSPYILTSANNLIYAHQLGQSKEAEVSRIVSKDSWMNPDKVGAYFVANGSVESIMDPEFRQIKAERIDEVSRKLNEEYDQLFDLED